MPECGVLPSWSLLAAEGPGLLLHCVPAVQRTGLPQILSRSLRRHMVMQPRPHGRCHSYRIGGAVCLKRDTNVERRNRRRRPSYESIITFALRAILARMTCCHRPNRAGGVPASRLDSVQRTASRRSASSPWSSQSSGHCRGREIANRDGCMPGRIATWLIVPPLRWANRCAERWAACNSDRVGRRPRWFSTTA